MKRFKKCYFCFMRLRISISAQFCNVRFADDFIPNIYGWMSQTITLSDAIGAPFRIMFPNSLTMKNMI